MTKRISWQWARQLAASQEADARHYADTRLCYELAGEVAERSREGVLGLTAERQRSAAQQSRVTRRLAGSDDSF